MIGSGSAGFAAAIAAREAKARVCIVERGVLGGECPNEACVPSKALLRAAKLVREAKDASAFGVHVQSVTANLREISVYRERVVDTITGGDGARYRAIAQKLGIELIQAKGVFVDAQSLEAGDALIQAGAFVIATGSEDIIPSIPGLSDVAAISWREAIRLSRTPKAMAIVGGGPVGVELATFFSAMGTRVLLFQRSSTILSHEDVEIAQLAHDGLKALGVEVYGNATVAEVINARGGIYGLKVQTDGDTRTHAVEEIVLAVGKHPRVSELNLHAAGVRLDAHSAPETDARGRTSVPRIFAAGDVDAGLMFTHTAHHEGMIAGHNAALAARGARTGWRMRDERVVPRVTFLDPEVASVGLTQQEATEKFGKVLVGRVRVSTLGRAVTDDRRQGLVKLLAHPKTRKVIGCHVFCDRAGEVIHEAALAMYLNATVDRLGSMIHAFPTYSEGLAAAAGAMKLE